MDTKAAIFNYNEFNFPEVFERFISCDGKYGAASFI